MPTWSVLQSQSGSSETMRDEPDERMKLWCHNHFAKTQTNNFTNKIAKYFPFVIVCDKLVGLTMKMQQIFDHLRYSGFENDVIILDLSPPQISHRALICLPWSIVCTMSQCRNHYTVITASQVAIKSNLFINLIQAGMHFRVCVWLPGYNSSFSSKTRTKTEMLLMILKVKAWRYLYFLTIFHIRQNTCTYFLYCMNEKQAAWIVQK